MNLDGLKLFMQPDGAAATSLITHTDPEGDGTPGTQDGKAGDGQPPSSADADPKPIDPWAEYREGEDKLIVGKYKTGNDLVKGYKEATAKLREKMPEPPASADDYKFEFSADSGLTVQDAQFFTKENPIWAHMSKAFHSAKVSQEQAVLLGGEFLKMEKASVEKEKQLLGADSDTLIGDANTYARKYMTEPGQKVLSEMLGQTAEGIKFLASLYRQQGEKPIPGTLNGVVGKTRDEAIVEAQDYMRDNPDIHSNPKKQRIYDNMMRVAAGGKPI